jgi:hypothetical protein
MSVLRRLAVVLGILIVVFAGSGEPRAICGYPAIVAASSFNGGSAYVVVYNPATFALTGITNFSLIGAFGDNAYKTALAAASATPPKFLYIVMGGVPICCSACCAGPQAGVCNAGPFWVGMYP